MPVAPRPLTPEEQNALANARTFVAAIADLPFDDLMGLFARMEDPVFEAMRDVSQRIRGGCPEASDLAYEARDAVTLVIWIHENTYIEHAETFIQYWGPINVAAVTAKAVAARPLLSKAEYADLTAPWRRVFGALPGDDATTDPP
jgi:hypothetical protein